MAQNLHIFLKWHRLVAETSIFILVSGGFGDCMDWKLKSSIALSLEVWCYFIYIPRVYSYNIVNELFKWYVMLTGRLTRENGVFHIAKKGFRTPFFLGEKMLENSDLIFVKDLSDMGQAIQVSTGNYSHVAILFGRFHLPC